MQLLFQKRYAEAGCRMHETEERAAHACRWTAADTSVRLLTIHEPGRHVAVLEVHGDIDLGTVPVLREALLAALGSQSSRVVADLSAVPFMDSAGVHVLGETFRRFESQSRQLVLVCREGGQVHRLLALVGLLEVVTVYRSRESAVVAGDGVLRSERAGNSASAVARDPHGGARTDLAPAVH